MNNRVFAYILAFSLVVTSCAVKSTSPSSSGAHDKTAAAFDKIRSDDSSLKNFLARMPKGGDLHSHLSGAVYAEKYIAWASEDGLCVDLSSYTLIYPPCDAASGKPDVATAAADTTVYNNMIDAWSMRNFTEGKETGHDHFFNAFGKFGAVSGKRSGDMLAWVMDNEAKQNVIYLELMLSLQSSAVSSLAKTITWTGLEDMESMRATLMANGLQSILPKAKTDLDNMESRARQTLNCGTPGASPGCDVTVRYILQVSRNGAMENVFTQSVFDFEMAQYDPRVVGLNFVQAEDGANSMNNYDTHMRLLNYLSGLAPSVNISLHAGELTPQVAERDKIITHIPLAVEPGRAKRVGHAVAIIYNDPAGQKQILRQLADNNVAVEILLSSNEQILRVSGAQHPFPMYLDYPVDTLLATDDQGISRSSITNEYYLAVSRYGLNYDTAKTLARQSLTQSFIGGGSLWKRTRGGFIPVDVCAGDAPGDDNPSAPCKSYVDGSRRATIQWKLEKQFADFENKTAVSGLAN